MSSVKFEDLASWLMVAFVLSREIPVIFQKVIHLYLPVIVKRQFSLN